VSGASIIWFRQDLRLADNPALQASLKRGSPVIPLFLWTPEEDGTWAMGAASRWWLHQSIQALDDSLRGLGSRLILRRGEALASLCQLCADSGAEAVYWNRRYEPLAVQRDRDIEQRLREAGLTVGNYNAALLFEPWEVAKRDGTPFRVFTPFWRNCLARQSSGRPAAAPARLPKPGRWPRSVPLEELSLLPAVNRAREFHKTWRPGEAGALAALRSFLNGSYSTYQTGRDQPDRIGTSRLSPHLHFGEIGPRQVWHAVAKRMGSAAPGEGEIAGETFLREIGWREFAHHILFHFPHTPEKPLRAEFASFPWARRSKDLRAWQQGRTGYPLVDAGMRELWATGWMHNRVRMVVASFLVKHLRIHWLEGARWFWDTLVDADLANNTLGWQWSAGCGADAAPYFRIFNPMIQSEKFDPQGVYLRRWVPELARLPNEWIHRPFEAPASVLSGAGVRLGRDYPIPRVNHSQARALALSALAKRSK
jgi:deoxyribodipyrimidine photo-lyase